MTERWRKYVDGGLDAAGNRTAAAYESWLYMAPVFRRIRTRFAPGSRILELGCGAGFQASILAAWGYRVTAVENDPGVVQIARITIEGLGLGVVVVQADALNVPGDWRGYDLAFSLGLVEHFDRGVTVGMLREQARVAPHVMAVIPSRYTRYAAPVTDERIYRLSRLKAMFRDAELAVEESFVFGDVPTWLGAATRRLLPPPIYRGGQNVFGYGMNLCVFGRRG